MTTVAGLDWASMKHDLLVIDEATGRVLDEGVFAHTERGLMQLLSTLETLGVTRIAVERPDGLLIERLLETGIAVIAMHPNQVAAARPRFQVAAGKSDRFDALVLAELARTDSHRFRVLRAPSDHIQALKAATRAREDLVRARVALANQLRAELDRFWPGASQIFGAIDTPIGLAFLKRYPSPPDARGLGPERLAGFLARERYCGRRTPEQLLERLHTAPTGRAGQLETETRRSIVLALVAALEPLVEQIRVLTSQIGHLLDAHPDGRLFRSFFKSRDSVLCAATLLAEIGDDRDRYPTPDSLAADAGMAPVAVESGKRHTAKFRRSCDHRLRTAFTVLADSTRHWHPVAHDHYASARARGHDHPRATRTVGRAWTRVLWRCWHHHQPYDPLLHNALQRRGG